MRNLILLVLASHSALAQEPIDEVTAASQAKMLHWKAGAFAGTVLLAVAAGIVVICLNGGTNPQTTHCDHKPHWRER